MTITPEQRATLAQTRARLDQFATLAAGDREHLAARQAEATAARREHKAAMKARKSDRRALEASTGPIPYVLPAAERPVPYALVN